MKKLTLLLITVLMTTVMYGQFHIGPQIGYTSSKLSYNTTDIQNSMQSNMVVGVFMRLGKKVYLQPELNYLTQGSVFRTPTLGNTNPVEQTVKLKSIQVPLSLGFQLLDIKVVKLRIFGGATANFVINKDVSPVTGSGVNPADYLTANNFKNSNFQYQVGAGVDVFMLTLDIKYYGPLDKLTNGGVKFDGKTIDAGSSVFMVTLGWKIL